MRSMNTERFQSLHVSEDGTGHRVTVELDHGRANEMGATELDDWMDANSEGYRLEYAPALGGAIS